MEKSRKHSICKSCLYRIPFPVTITEARRMAVVECKKRQDVESCICCDKYRNRDTGKKGIFYKYPPKHKRILKEDNNGS